tara:strand:+ start:2963 stop:3124 length:162 start_codon:yes stop_codon:yes gene_type:complete
MINIIREILEIFLYISFGLLDKNKTHNRRRALQKKEMEDCCSKTLTLLVIVRI